MAGVSGSAGAWRFLAGLALGFGASAAWNSLGRKRRLDPRILRALPRTQQAPMVVFVPGLLGSQLLRKDGSVAWLNLGNTFGHHDLSLPRELPFKASRDELYPGFLIGTDSALPRAFGFTEYADLLELLDTAGYEPGIIGRFSRAFVRTSSFIGKELTEVRRQPRLLLSLVLGPFLILFLFGIGYAATPRDIKTVVVFPPGSPLINNADQYRDAFAKPFVLDSVTEDAQAARQRLADRQIQAVIYFPPDAYATILNGQRATLQVDYNEIDPLTAEVHPPETPRPS